MAILITQTDGRDGLRLQLGRTDSGSVLLTTEEVDRLMVDLARARAHLNPPIRQNFTIGHHHDVVRDQPFMVEVEALKGDVFLNIRDPRFGWLRFLFPKSAARTLAKMMQDLAEEVPPAQQFQDSKRKRQS